MIRVVFNWGGKARGGGKKRGLESVKKSYISLGYIIRLSIMKKKRVWEYCYMVLKDGLKLKRTVIGRGRKCCIEK